jgi:hypothetical protein
MNEQLATFFERLAGKESAQRFLHRMGLDPRQFVLFLGLFRTLSERGEFAGGIGVSRFNIAYLALYAAAIGVIPWLGLAGVLPARTFLIVNLSVVFAFSFLIIIREAPNSLFNPVEVSILAHNPVHTPTYAAAKIAHLLLAVLYLVSGFALYPALIGALVNKETRWFWPATHLAAAFLIGLWTAFLICALYGLLRRIVPANLLKGISMWIQLLTLIGFTAILIFFPVSIFRLLLLGFQSDRWTWLPLTWFVELGRLGCRNAVWQLEWHGVLSIAATTVIIGYGLCSFSDTYFAESSSMVEGGAGRDRKKTILARRYSDIVRAMTGSPPGLGAFCFVSKMMRRDWQFRRVILTQTWIPLVVLVAIILVTAHGGWPPSPLGHESPFHILPHLMGLITMALCVNLCFSDFYSGSWIYLTTPIASLRSFARGIYFALWVPAAGVIHIVMLPFLIRFWGWKEAVLLAGFSLILVSFYLGIEISLIAGLPFSSPIDESRAMLSAVYIQMCWLGSLIFPTTLQWGLFQFYWVALLSAIVLAVLTWIVLHWNLGGLEQEMRWRLHKLKMGPNLIFKQIE